MEIYLLPTQKRVDVRIFAVKNALPEKRQDVVRIHEWYYSGAAPVLQGLVCINISIFLRKELVILLTPRSVPETV
jgi:hypothetical protein